MAQCGDLVFEAFGVVLTISLPVLDHSCRAEVRRSSQSHIHNVLNVVCQFLLPSHMDE